MTDEAITVGEVAGHVAEEIQDVADSVGEKV